MIRSWSTAPANGAAARGNHMMSSILSRLFAGPAAPAPAGIAPAGFTFAEALPHIAMADLFAGFRTRHGGGKRKPESPDVAQSWAEFGRGF